MAATRRARGLIALLLVALLGCGTAAPPTPAAPPAPTPPPAPGAFERAFAQALPARVADGDARRRVLLHDCRELVAQHAQLVGSDDDASWRVLRLQAVPCLAMALAQRARPARRTALPARFDASQPEAMALARYPATLWVAPSPDEQEAIAQPGMELARASGLERWQADAGAGLSVTAHGFRVRLTPLARGDFDGDGWEDAAFQWEAQSLQGSYVDARLVVLTRRAAGEPLRELSVAELLRGHR